MDGEETDPEDDHLVGHQLDGSGHDGQHAVKPHVGEGPRGALHRRHRDDGGSDRHGAGLHRRQWRVRRYDARHDGRREDEEDETRRTRPLEEARDDGREDALRDEVEDGAAETRRPPRRRLTRHVRTGEVMRDEEHRRARQVHVEGDEAADGQEEEDGDEEESCEDAKWGRAEEKHGIRISFENWNVITITLRDVTQRLLFRPVFIQSEWFESEAGCLGVVILIVWPWILIERFLRH